MSINNEANTAHLPQKPPEKSRNYWWSPFLATGMGFASSSQNAFCLFPTPTQKVELSDECELAIAVEAKQLRK
ncbi:MAG: hypothetical protein P4M14_13195 [Gammaproteobacteria bacterium]|nr:hypothetical protein [Gammaproteobacteria bacterium]